MPGLRERVIDAICEEAWPHPDHEVNSTTIYERLKRNGVNTSKAEVEQVLDHLKDARDIYLAANQPGRGPDPVVQAVHPELCPEPLNPA